MKFFIWKLLIIKLLRRRRFTNAYLTRDCDPPFSWLYLVAINLKEDSFTNADLTRDCDKGANASQYEDTYGVSFTNAYLTRDCDTP